MFAKLVKKRESKYDEPMRKILIALDDEKIGSEKHIQLTAQLERYEKLKALEPKRTIDWTPIIAAAISGGTGLLSVGIITKHEKVDIIGGKAVNFAQALFSKRS